MIFNLKVSIVPSFINDSNTSSGVITEDVDDDSIPTNPKIILKQKGWVLERLNWNKLIDLDQQTNG